MSRHGLTLKTVTESHTTRSFADKTGSGRAALRGKLEVNLGGAESLKFYGPTCSIQKVVITWACAPSYRGYLVCCSLAKEACLS